MSQDKLDKDFLVVIGNSLDEMSRKDKNRKIRSIVEFIIKNDIDFESVQEEYLRKTKQLVKFKNPITNETWSGKGRQPKWLRELLEQGYKLDELKH